MCSSSRPLGFVALLVLLVATPRQLWADGLSASQIERKIIGHTWAWTSQEFDTSGTSTYFRDGRLLVTIEGWDRPQRGVWQIKDDQLCSTLVGNSENCSKSITEIDDRTFFWESSKSTFVLKE
jgi:hypothetical protein